MPSVLEQEYRVHEEHPPMELVEMAHLFAIVGSSEEKALVLPRLRKKGTYTRDYLLHDIKRAVQLGQGVPPVSYYSVIKHVETVLIPYGLVAEISVRGQSPVAYAITDYGDERVVPFLGHVLRFSEEHSQVALSQLVGDTRIHAPFSQMETPWGPMLYKKRPQIARLKVLAALASVDIDAYPLRETDLAEMTGQDRRLVSIHLRQLSDAGVLVFESHDADAPYVSFQLTRERPAKDPLYAANGLIHKRDIYAIFLAHPEEMLTLDRVADLLTEAHPELKEVRRDRIASQLKHMVPYLERKGYVSRGKFTRKNHSEIKLSSSQYKVLKDFAALLNTLHAQDRATLLEGKMHAYNITVNPARVTALLLKAREASRPKGDHAATKRQLLAAVFEKTNGTTRSLQRALQTVLKNTINITTVREYLHEIEAEGLIESFKRENEKSLRWRIKSSQDEDVS